MGNRQRWIWGVIVLAVLWMGYVGWSYQEFVGTCREMARQGVPGHGKAIPWSTDKKEAIVVLTGDRGRIPRAIELLRERGTPLLLVSGAGRRVTKRDLINQQGDAAAFIHETWERIEMESESGTTVENALESGKILAKNGIHRVILVTSDYHMPRALKVFQIVKGEFEYFPYPVASEIYPLTSAGAEEFDGWWKFLVEFWKYFLFVHVYSLFL